MVQQLQFDDLFPGGWSANPTRWTDAELLAWLVPTDRIATVQAVLTDAGWIGVQRALTDGHYALGDLGSLAAAFEVGRRVLLPPACTPLQIRGPHQIAHLLQAEMAYLEQEQFRTICLDTRNQVQCIHIVYLGTLNRTAIRISEVFREALRRNSAAIIVCHNHPSGDPTPSPEDVTITRQLVEAGRLLEIDLLDHLIIGAGRYISLGEEGLLAH